MTTSQKLRILTLTVAMLVATAVCAAPQRVVPAQGDLEASSWPFGLSSVSLYYPLPPAISRSGGGMITLERDGRLIAGVPVQNTEQLALCYVDDAIQMGDDSRPTGQVSVDITFFREAVGSPATIPGNYVVTIPEGVIAINGRPEDEIRLSWTLQAPTLEPYSITPAAGEVADLSSISLTFPEAAEVRYSDDPVTSVTPGGEVVNLPFELLPVSLGSDRGYHPTVSAHGNVLTLSFDDLLPPRLYRLRILQGAVHYTLHGTEYALPETVVYYRLQGDKIGVWKLDIFPPEGIYATPELHSTGCPSMPEALFSFHLPDHWSLLTSGAWLVSEDNLIEPLQLKMTMVTDQEERPLVCVNRMTYPMGRPTPVAVNIPAGRYRVEVREGALCSGNMVNPPLVFDYQYYSELPCETSPANGSVLKSLNDITLDFGDSSVGVNADYRPTLENGTFTYLCSLEKTGEGRVHISVPGGDVKQSGVWHLRIPAEALTVDGAATLVAPFWYVNMSVSSLPKPMVDPKEGSTLSIVPTFRLEGKEEIRGLNPMVCGLYTASGDRATDLAVPLFPSMNESGNGIILTPMIPQGEYKPVLAPDAYRLVLPQGLWYTDSGVSPAMEFAYNFVYPPLENVDITPAPDATLDHFYYFTVTLARGEEVVEVSDEVATLEGPVGDPAVAPGVVACFRAEAADEPGFVELNNVRGYDVVTYVPDGEYLLRLPERLFTTTRGYLAATDVCYRIERRSGSVDLHPAEEATTLTGAGVHGPGSGNIVSLSGIVYDLPNISTLPSGIYIYKGKKLIIR